MKQSSAITIIKILALLSIAYLSQFIIPYLGFFPYGDILDSLILPLPIKSFANFDGVQYLLVAKQGYMTYQQAYFPLYPMLISIIGDLLHIGYFYSGLIISNIGFAIGLHYFYKLLRIDFDRRKSLIGILFLILFPTSFYFHVIYTEGLFFALFVSFLYFLRKDDLKKALFISIFLSATKLIGVFSIVFLIPYILSKALNLIASSKGVAIPLKSNRTIPYNNIFTGCPGIASLTLRMCLAMTLAPFVGLLIYMIYLWQTTGDPFFFFHSQTAFGANRSTHIIFLPQVYYRYFKMLFTASFNWQYIVVLLEFISFTFVAIILSLDLWKLLFYHPGRSKATDRVSDFSLQRFYRSLHSLQNDKQGTFLLCLNLFSWINILLPTLTGTFSSVPRYALFSLSIFYFLAGIKNKFLQYSLLTIFAVLQIILFAFFIQGYFIA